MILRVRLCAPTSAPTLLTPPCLPVSEGQLLNNTTSFSKKPRVYQQRWGNRASATDRSGESARRKTKLSRLCGLDPLLFTRFSPQFPTQISGTGIYFHHTGGLRRRPSKGRRRSKCPQATQKNLQTVVYDAKGRLSRALEMSDYSLIYGKMTCYEDQRPNGQGRL